MVERLPPGRIILVILFVMVFLGAGYLILSRPVAISPSRAWLRARAAV